MKLFKIWKENFSTIMQNLINSSYIILEFKEYNLKWILFILLFILFYKSSNEILVKKIVCIY